jgi:hypothetical protein
VVPSSAWHSHDAWHLLNFYNVSMPSLRLSFSRSGNDEDASAPSRSVRTAFEEPGPVSLLLGETCFYAESGQHWMVGDYATQDTYMLLGRSAASELQRETARQCQHHHGAGEDTIPLKEAVLRLGDGLAESGRGGQENDPRPHCAVLVS